MITNYTALAALRATVATTVRPASAYDAFILNGGKVTVCRPSLRGYRKLTLTPYDVRKTKTSGNISGTGSRRQKFEPIYILR